MPFGLTSDIHPLKNVVKDCVQLEELWFQGGWNLGSEELLRFPSLLPKIRTLNTDTTTLSGLVGKLPALEYARVQSVDLRLEMLGLAPDHMDPDPVAEVNALLSFITLKSVDISDRPTSLLRDLLIRRDNKLVEIHAWDLLPNLRGEQDFQAIRPALAEAPVKSITIYQGRRFGTGPFWETRAGKAENAFWKSLDRCEVSEK
jgi:hypothetical protein